MYDQHPRGASRAYLILDRVDACVKGAHRAKGRFLRFPASDSKIA